jgi:hypothetical protein
MTETLPDPVLVIASPAERPPDHRVWGTGGWLPPEQREALDWVCLVRLLGWGATVAGSQDRSRWPGPSDGGRWLILACDPDSLGEEGTRYLRDCLEVSPLLVVARAGEADGPFAKLAGAARRPAELAGRSLLWTGPGPQRHWRCPRPLGAAPLGLSGGASAWATADGEPLVAARRVGRGAVASLGFHPSQARDADGAATALLSHLLVWGAGAPVAWFDWEGSLVLRMDDPGGAQNVHLRSWSYPKIGEAGWTAIAGELRRRDARLSIGYVAGWADDGDPSRGELLVDGRAVPRVPGRVHPSPRVRYRTAREKGATLHDYEAEFRGIQALRAAGLAEVELHGYTHVHPDRLAWSRAPDRYDSVSWYRELGPGAEAATRGTPPGQHPLALGERAVRHQFDTRPTTLICPGDQWTNEALERGLDLGLSLVSSYYLALRDRDRWCWTTHVCAPYLDEPDAAWFRAGLPVVGYFHDREPALEGAVWLSTCLDRWTAAGARRMLDFRELASAVGRRLRLDECRGGLRLTALGAGAPPLVRPLPVLLRLPDRRPPARLSAGLDDDEMSLAVEPVGEWLGRVCLPSPAITPAAVCQ